MLLCNAQCSFADPDVIDGGWYEFQLGRIADRRQTIRCPHFAGPTANEEPPSSRLPASNFIRSCPATSLLPHYPSHLCDLRPLIDTHDPLNIFPSRPYSSATTVDPVYAPICAANLRRLSRKLEAPWLTIQVRACLLFYHLRSFLHLRN
jgi:hypothetical protein